MGCTALRSKKELILELQKRWDINLNSDFFQVNFMNQTLVCHDVFMWTKAWLGQKFLVKKKHF